MSLSKESLLEKAKSASSAEELQQMAKEHGFELSQSDAINYFDFLHGSEELSDDELSMITGGKKSHECSMCTSAPIPICTGSGFLFGLDACPDYYETADPNGMPTAWTYPVLCYCKKNYFSDFPMNRPNDT